MSPNETPIGGGHLADLEVVIEGKWKDGRQGDWHGVVRAESPLVGVGFVGYPDGTSWHKSGRPGPDGLEVRLYLGWHDQGGQDVQVMFGIGGGAVSRTFVSTAAYRPVLSATITTRTGRVLHLATVDGTPPVKCGLLFLSAKDVKMGRNRLWHLHRELALHVDEPPRSILSYGRSGTLTSPDVVP